MFLGNQIFLLRGYEHHVVLNFTHDKDKHFFVFIFSSSLYPRQLYLFKNTFNLDRFFR